MSNKHSSRNRSTSSKIAPKNESKNKDNSTLSKNSRRVSRRVKFGSENRHGHFREGCLQKAQRIFTVMNVFFILSGASILGMAIWASTGIYGKMSEAGEGYNIGTPFSVFAVLVIVTAIFGELGARKDIKIFLLVYFVLAFLALLGILVVGSLNYNGKSEMDTTGNEWWDNFDESLRIQVQTKFECCGYENADDRPAGSCENDIPQLSGCQQAFRTFFEEREMPAVLFSITVAIALMMSIGLSMYLVCRSTRKNPSLHRKRGMSGMYMRNKVPMEEQEYEKFEGKQTSAPISLQQEESEALMFQEEQKGSSQKKNTKRTSNTVTR